MPLEAGQTLYLSGSCPTEAECKALVAAAESAMEPLDLEEVLDALASLVARVKKTNALLEESSTVEWTRGMAIVLARYPADLVWEFVDEWPHRSEFYPLEKEAINVLDAKLRLRRTMLFQLKAMAATDWTGLRVPIATGQTAELVAHAAFMYGDQYVAGYLSATTCEFTPNAIYTTFDGARRLNLDCGSEARRLGVSIEHCKSMDRKLRITVEAMKAQGVLK